jgi:hypothetical protein
MARKANSQLPPSYTEIKHFDSEAEIDRGIEKLIRCKTLLDELWDDQAAYDDPRTRTLTDKIHTAVLEIFGPNSPEYGRHQYHRIWHGAQYMSMPKREFQAGFRAGFPHTGVMLKSLMDRLEEARSDLSSDSTARTRPAFEGLDLHTRIGEATRDLYRGAHYRQAVLDASIALVNYLKEKSRRHDLDGSGLMSTVFSPNKPVLAFNGLSNQTEMNKRDSCICSWAPYWPSEIREPTRYLTTRRR